MVFHCHKHFGLSYIYFVHIVAPFSSSCIFWSNILLCAIQHTNKYGGGLPTLSHWIGRIYKFTTSLTFSWARTYTQKYARLSTANTLHANVQHINMYELYFIYINKVRIRVWWTLGLGGTHTHNIYIRVDIYRYSITKFIYEHEWFDLY